jgi:ABC-type multidrug transport system fused ATPase/permease subunit
VANNLMLVRVLGTKERERQRLRSELNDQADTSWRASLASSIASGIPALLGALALVVLALCLDPMDLSLSLAAPLAYLAARLIASIGNLTATYGVLLTSLASARELLVRQT